MIDPLEQIEEYLGIPPLIWHRRKSIYSFHPDSEYYSQYDQFVFRIDLIDGLWKWFIGNKCTNFVEPVKNGVECTSDTAIEKCETFFKERMRRPSSTRYQRD